MKLDGNDQINFSELIEHEVVDRQNDAYLKNLRPFIQEVLIDQGIHIENKPRFDHRKGMAQLYLYDIREFVNDRFPFMGKILVILTLLAGLTK